MAKSRRPGAKRAPAQSRRGTSPRRTTRSSSRRSKPSPIKLKPIRTTIERAIAKLRRTPSNDAVKVTIERLERCLMEFDAICDPESKQGCGPTMTFPGA